MGPPFTAGTPWLYLDSGPRAIRSSTGPASSDMVRRTDLNLCRGILPEQRRGRQAARTLPTPALGQLPGPCPGGGCSALTPVRQEPGPTWDAHTTSKQSPLIALLPPSPLGAQPAGVRVSVQGAELCHQAGMQKSWSPQPWV